MNILQPYEKIWQRIQDEYKGPKVKEFPYLPVYAWYFNERERIRIYREDNGLPPPWTADPIFRNFRFTNIRREDDRVSRELLAAMQLDAPPGTLLFNSFVYRTFNSAIGFEKFGGFTHLWTHGDALARLDEAHAAGVSLFGNAYLMCNSLAEGAPKHRFYLKTFDLLWEQRTRFVQELRNNPSIEYAVKLFKTLPGYAEFLAYEMALDMEMIGLLKDPVDKFTWANPGPGARRGLQCLRGEARPPKGTNLLEEMRDLHELSIAFLEPHVPEPFDMRCIENGLCETSKYFSVLTKGRAKRRFNP